VVPKRLRCAHVGHGHRLGASSAREERVVLPSDEAVGAGRRSAADACGLSGCRSRLRQGWARGGSPVWVRADAGRPLRGELSPWGGGSSTLSLNIRRSCHADVSSRTMMTMGLVCTAPLAPPLPAGEAERISSRISSSTFIAGTQVLTQYLYCWYASTHTTFIVGTQVLTQYLYRADRNRPQDAGYSSTHEVPPTSCSAPTPRRVCTFRREPTALPMSSERWPRLLCRPSARPSPCHRLQRCEPGGVCVVPTPPTSGAQEGRREGVGR
jgi:hypothetical protein